MFRYLCTGRRANATICANINAFKFEFENGGKIPTLSPEKFKGTGTSYQKPSDF